MAGDDDLFTTPHTFKKLAKPDLGFNRGDGAHKIPFPN